MENAAELLRLISNLIRLGTIAEVDHERARARVKSGELLTDWLVWLTPRAGTTRDWDPPTVGEQVMVLSESGDLTNGLIVPAVYSNPTPAPSHDPALYRRVYPDGAVIEYDHASHALRATIPGSAALHTDTTLTATAGGNATIDTQAKLTATAADNAEVATQAQLIATAAAGAIINADTVINGNLAINGNLSQASGNTATMAGAVHFTGAVTSNGKDISADHEHSGVESGSSNTGPVV
jgi:phage baseplate assembly protein V